MNIITLVIKFIMNIINLVICNSVATILKEIFLGGPEMFLNYSHVLSVELISNNILH